MGPEALAVVQALWDLVTGHFERFAVEAEPGALARSVAAAGTRARVIAELGEAHAAALTGLLGVLRSRHLDDAAARAPPPRTWPCRLVELRAQAERDQQIAEGTGRPGLRAARGVAAAPGALQPGAAGVRRPGSTRSLPGRRGARGAGDGAGGADAGAGAGGRGPRARGLAVRRGDLHATVRDDGPGTLTPADLEGDRVQERLGVLDGRVEVEAVPGWGTTVTAVVPLGGAAPDPRAAAR